MIRLFLLSLLNRWFEYVAAAMVVALAVAALVIQGSLTSSAEKQVHDLAHHLGKNMLVVPEETDLSRFYALEYGDATVPDSYPQRLTQSRLGQHIRGVQASLMGNVEAKGVPLVLVGQPDLTGAMGWRATDGTTPAALGDVAAVRLNVNEQETLNLEGKRLTVALVSPSLPDGLDMGVFTDLEPAQEVLGKPGGINSMHVGGCWCKTDVPALALDVEQELPGTRAVTVAGVIQSQQGTISTVKRYSKVLFAVAILLIVGITVILITAQIRRQTREIGLLLAIGASGWQISLFFIAIAALIGAVGGLAGLMLGAPLTRVVADRFMGSELPASPDLFAPILATTILASVAAVLVPALRAARTDPTTILREV
jgi:putative ABC transport system permease protein